MGDIIIAVHGGAGTILRSAMNAEKEQAYRQALAEAVSAGHTLLKAGKSALDAVEASVQVLEDSPLFNAGRGSVFTHEGQQEMDAALMDGSTGQAGAVAGITLVKNPVSLARAVMEQTEHVFLCGAGAEVFADEVKAKRMPSEYFYSQERYDQLQQALKLGGTMMDHSDDKKFGTVGAVALDSSGNVAAATSTGGMTNKQYGRIGDTPMIGAGTYASNQTCAVSCTGHGEYFIRSVVAYDVACLMEYAGLSLEAACQRVVQDKLVKTGGEGGLIAISPQGEVQLAFNSEGMYRGAQHNDEPVYTGIYKD